MSLTDEQIDSKVDSHFMKLNNLTPYQWRSFARAIESATAAPLLERIAGLEANEKVLLAQIQGNTAWRERIIRSSERAYGESAIRYKFSLTKHGKCMNTFPREIDGRWFALTPAEDDGHIGHIARIAELEQQLEAARKDAERYRWLRNFHAGEGGIRDDLPHIAAGGNYVGAWALHSSMADAAIDAAISKEQA